MSMAAHRKFCVAPMMKRTDRHFRRLLRMISRRAMLYTEMISTGAVRRGDRRRLEFDEIQRPLGLQVGGSAPAALGECARIAEDLGYDEINLNVGCPSLRAGAGEFGACLMREPARVGDCVAAMAARSEIPVTVKCRLGVEEKGEKHSDEALFAGLCRFVEIVSGAGCRTFAVHARTAMLGGLSPKKNRVVPPLRYSLVLALKREFPRLEIILNGGLKSPEHARREARLDEPGGLDGVMLGRAVYQDPMLLAHIDAAFYGEECALISRERVLQDYLGYLEREAARGASPSLIGRHLIHWFRGQPGAKRWRRGLTERNGQSGKNRLRNVVTQGEFAWMANKGEVLGSSSG